MSVATLPITVEGLKSLLSYSRDSNEKTLGIFGQEQEIRDWGEAHGYEIVGYARDGITAQAPPTAREGFAAALGVLRSTDTAGLIVHRLDRLARDVEPMLDAVERVWDTGADIYATDLGRIPRGKKGREVAIQAAMRGKAELDAIRQRLQAGRARAQSLGAYTGGPRLGRKYGYWLDTSVAPARYVPIPEEQAVIRRMAVACPCGRGYAAMARQLNAEGVPTAGGAAKWSAETVKKVVLRGPQVVVMVNGTDAAVMAPAWEPRHRAVLGRQAWPRA
jgi:DNA invertase Pin-like site-specific DNA recombinase